MSHHDNVRKRTYYGDELARHHQYRGLSSSEDDEADLDLNIPFGESHESAMMIEGDDVQAHEHISDDEQIAESLYENSLTVVRHRTSKVHANRMIKKIYTEEDLPDPPEVDRPKKRKYPEAVDSPSKKHCVNGSHIGNDSSHLIHDDQRIKLRIRLPQKDDDQTSAKDDLINALLSAVGNGRVCVLVLPPLDAPKMANEMPGTQKSIQTIGDQIEDRNQDLLNESILKLRRQIEESKFAQRTNDSTDSQDGIIETNISIPVDQSLNASITKRSDHIKKISTSSDSLTRNMRNYRLPGKNSYVMISDVIMYCAKNAIGLKIRAHQPTKEKIAIEIVSLNRLIDYVQSSEIGHDNGKLRSNVMQFLRGWFQRPDPEVKNFTVANGFVFNVKAARYYRTKNAIF